jgi:hypothetical protein
LYYRVREPNYKKYGTGIILVTSCSAQLADEPYLYNVNVGDLCLIVYQNFYMQDTKGFLVQV